MYQYSLYGQNILSSMEFPQLNAAQENKESDILIVAGGIPSEIMKEADNRYYKIKKQESWFQNDTGVFYITNGKEIHYSLKKDANIQYARTYLLGYAISMALLQKDMVTIHCSAICKDDGAILLAGQSGSGKSTITSNFLKKGYKLLADDIVAVGISEEKKVMAYPAFPYQKLCRDTIEREGIKAEGLIYIDEEKDKFLVPRKNQFMEKPVELKVLILLGTDEGVDLVKQEITGVDKIMAIRENLFLRRLQGDWLVKPKLIQTCVTIGSKMPMYTVVRPQNKDTRREVTEYLNHILEVN